MTSRGVLNGTTSEYTFASRILRAISCVYWEPKSRTRMVSSADDITPHYINRRIAHGDHVTLHDQPNHYDEKTEHYCQTNVCRLQQRDSDGAQKDEGKHSFRKPQATHHRRQRQETRGEQIHGIPAQQSFEHPDNEPQSKHDDAADKQCAAAFIANR